MVVLGGQRVKIHRKNEFLIVHLILRYFLNSDFEIRFQAAMSRRMKVNEGK